MANLKLVYHKPQMIKENFLNSHDAAWLMLNNTHLAAAIVDLEGKVLELNPEMAHRFGKTVEEMRDTLIYQYMPLDIAEGRRSVMLKALDTGLPQISSDCREGKWNLYHCHYVPSDKHSQPLFVFYALDITEQRQAEIELQKSEELFLTTINSLQEIIFVIDSNFNVILANESCLKQLEELNLPTSINGKTVSQAFPFLDKSILDNYQKIITNGEPVMINSRYNINEREIYTEIRLTPVYENGKVTRVVTAVTDISRLKKNELDLRATITAKDRFMSIIAHDLINPINSTAQLAGILNQEFESMDELKKKYYVKALSETLERTSNLAANLLVWSRSQRGQLQIHFADFSIAGLAQEVMSLLQPIADKKNIHVELHDISTRIEVYADREMISAVLRNLISNAIKFTKSGGYVSVSTLKDESNRVRISVKDTGVGINKIDFPKLLDPNADYTTLGTENEKGTGLGLILCQDFLQKHASGLEIESEPGKGSAFSFILKSTA